MLAVYRALYISILLAFSRRIIRHVCSESICLIPAIPDIPYDYDGFALVLYVKENSKLDTSYKIPIAIPIAKIPTFNDVPKLMSMLDAMRCLVRDVYAKDYSENFRFVIRLYLPCELALLNISHSVPGIPSRVLGTIITRLQEYLKAVGL